MCPLPEMGLGVRQHERERSFFHFRYQQRNSIVTHLFVGSETKRPSSIVTRDLSFLRQTRVSWHFGQSNLVCARQ